MMISKALYMETGNERLTCQGDLNILFVIWPYYLLHILGIQGEMKRAGKNPHPYHEQIIQK